MAALLSRKKLADALKEMNLIPLEFDYRRLDNEVYGRDARIYLWKVASNKKERRRIEDELERRGFKVNRGYWIGSNAIEVRVSYFKGFHWDE